MNIEEMRQAVTDLRGLGPKAVLLKGGHLSEGDAILVVAMDVELTTMP